MIFSELYSAYYNTVARVLKAAIDHPLKKDELRALVEENAFGESILNIEPALREERWQLIRADGTTPLEHTPSMPLTTLQKSWLKAVVMDPRIKLFTDELSDYGNVEPLFTSADYCVFDQYSDGDPYTEEGYIRNFRIILKAIKEKIPLSIETRDRRGNLLHRNMMPGYLEYSEKDDKFRLIGTGNRFGNTVNVGRIVRCEMCPENADRMKNHQRTAKSRSLEFELLDTRNALDRVLLHFAHFQKEVEKIGERMYRVVLYYDKDDETELVIRILSFGPMVKVTKPSSFVELIKERLKNQKDCLL